MPLTLVFTERLLSARHYSALSVLGGRACISPFTDQEPQRDAQRNDRARFEPLLSPSPVRHGRKKPLVISR